MRSHIDRKKLYVKHFLFIYSFETIIKILQNTLIKFAVKNLSSVNNHSKFYTGKPVATTSYMIFKKLKSYERAMTNGELSTDYKLANTPAFFIKRMTRKMSLDSILFFKPVSI